MRKGHQSKAFPLSSMRGRTRWPQEDRVFGACGLNEPNRVLAPASPDSRSRDRKNRTHSNPDSSPIAAPRLVSPTLRPRVPALPLPLSTQYFPPITSC